MMNEGVGSGNTCKCMHHKFGAILVVVFGFLFLGGAMGWWGENIVSLGWPVLVIIAGGFKFMEKGCKCC